jgi:hypothetical protein
MGGACSAHGGDEKVYSIFIGKPEGRTPLGRPRQRWELHFAEVGLDGKDVIGGK